MQIIGHRGGRNLWPENSLYGFQQVADMPIHGVEFDVHLTTAGELLVIHDALLDRTTHQTGAVADLPPGARHDVQLKGENGGSLPNLEEVLTILGPTRLELHIELKASLSGQPYAGLERRTAAIVDALGLEERSILTSFQPQVLRTVREVAPHIRTLSSFDRNSSQRTGLISGLREMLEVSDVIAVQKDLLSAHWDEIIEVVPCESLGVWVPNEPEDLRFWLAKPIRQLTTDRPDLALAFSSS